MSYRGPAIAAVSSAALMVALSFPRALWSQSAPQLQWEKWTPTILSATRTDPILLQVAIGGGPSRVVFELNPGSPSLPSDYEMHDDGRDGDDRAGDGVYAVMLPAQPIVTGLQIRDVQRRFVGFVRVYQGSTVAVSGNLFVSMTGADIPAAPVVHHNVDVQSTDYIVNIFDPAFFNAIDYRRVTSRVYQYFPDTFDVLNIVYQPSFFQNRFHVHVKNEVRGIGVSLLDNSAQYGSAGRLQGVSVFPLGEYFDGAENGFLHEFGHQWINFAPLSPLREGGPHWPVGSAATGVMGYGANGQGLEFRCRMTEEPGGIRLTARTDEASFTDWDLYLMGLLPASEVAPQIVFANQALTGAACNGQLFTGPVTRVGIDELIAAAGPRVPAADGKPRRFRLGTVIVSRDGLLSDDAMAFYNYFASRMELTTPTPIHVGFLTAIGKPLPVATGGRASFDGRLLPLASDFALSVSPDALSISRTQSGTVSITLRSSVGAFSNPVSFSCGTLPAGAACTFSPASAVPGETTTSIGLRITPSTAAGTYTVPIYASSGTLRRTITVQLVVS
jgi:hypothetical protein